MTTELFDAGVMNIDGNQVRLLRSRFSDLVGDVNANASLYKDLILAVFADEADQFVARFNAMKGTPSRLTPGAKDFEDYQVLRTMLLEGHIRLVNSFAYHSFVRVTDLLNLIRAVDGMGIETDEDMVFHPIKLSDDEAFMLNCVTHEVRRLYSEDVQELIDTLHGSDYPIQVLMRDGVQEMVLVMDSGILPVWTLS